MSSWDCPRCNEVNPSHAGEWCPMTPRDQQPQREYNRVFRTEDGEYLTIPDGDTATVEEICNFRRRQL